MNITSLSQVCRADTSILTPASVFCDFGWESIDGACFIFDATKKELSWSNSENECKKMDASLPSIISRDVRDFPLHFERNHINESTYMNKTIY